jgi:hypothetical protein
VIPDSRKLCHDLLELSLPVPSTEIFRDDRDRWKFVGYLTEGSERYRMKMHCYVLMENHFHRVATTPKGNFKVDASAEDRVHGLL